MEITNTVRERVWRQQPRGFLTEAFIDTDGTVAPTFGKCKGGMALSYKGIWGYAPLAVSLANTNEVLYLVNRPGNVVSHEGSIAAQRRTVCESQRFSFEIVICEFSRLKNPQNTVLAGSAQFFRDNQNEYQRKLPFSDIQGQDAC